MHRQSNQAPELNRTDANEAPMTGDDPSREDPCPA